MVKLKEVEYQDEEGRKFLVGVPEGWDGLPEEGIAIGPPDLEDLGLPLEYEVRLNNQLFDRKLFKPVDVRRRPEEIEAALKAVFRVDVLAVRAIYGR